MLFHEPLEAGQLGVLETVIGGEGDGAQPELGLPVLAFHVDMRRLGFFMAVESESDTGRFASRLA